MGVGVGDVAADAGHHLGAVGEHLVEHRPHVGRLRLRRRVDAARGRRPPGGRGRSTASASHPCSGRRRRCARPARRGGGTPPRPRRSSRPTGSSACPRWSCRGRGAGQLDVEAAAGHRLGEPAHRRRVAGEAVQREHAGARRRRWRGATRARRRAGGCEVIPTFYRLAPRTRIVGVVAPTQSPDRGVGGRGHRAGARHRPVLPARPAARLAGGAARVGRVVLVVRPRLRGCQRAAVRAPDPGARADAAVRCPPADRRRAASGSPRSGATSPSPTTCRPTATSCASCRATSSTPSPAAATSSSSRRSPSTSCPAASSPACSPTSSATTSACTPSA